MRPINVGELINNPGNEGKSVNSMNNVSTTKPKEPNSMNNLSTIKPMEPYSMNNLLATKPIEPNSMHNLFTTKPLEPNSMNNLFTTRPIEPTTTRPPFIVDNGQQNIERSKGKMFMQFLFIIDSNFIDRIYYIFIYNTFYFHYRTIWHS